MSDRHEQGDLGMTSVCWDCGAVYWTKLGHQCEPKLQKKLPKMQPNGHKPKAEGM